MLLLLAAADARQLAAQLVVAAVSGELMREPVGLELRAVHENDARARIGVDGVLVVGLDVEPRPVEKGIVHFAGIFGKGIHCAYLLCHSFPRAPQNIRDKNVSILAIFVMIRYDKGSWVREDRI